MSLTRRSFVKTVGLCGAALLRRPRRRGRRCSRGRARPFPPTPLLLHNNENPLGPGTAALDAVRAAIGGGRSRGPLSLRPVRALNAAIAEQYGVKPENVVLGCGSTQMLTSAVQMFTSTTKPLVGGDPELRRGDGYAERIGTPVRAIPLDAHMKLDLNAMADASRARAWCS